MLRDIYLGFVYGAKIGVLGLNGSGKSSLLKIDCRCGSELCGRDHTLKGYSVGLFEQEPQLDPNKTVKEVVEEGKKELVALLHRIRSGQQQHGDAGPDEMEKLIDKAGTVAGEDRRRRTGGTTKVNLKSPWMPFAVRPPIKSECPLEEAKNAVWRSAASASPGARHSAADEPTQPSRRRIGCNGRSSICNSTREPSSR